MKVCFVSDLFEAQIVGGAEKNDGALISYLRDKNVDLEILHCSKLNVETASKYDFFIISNFILLNEEVKSHLAINANYIIYEHDHKYVKSRNPAVYEDFVIPESHKVNVDFYKNSKQIVVLSEICKKILEQNLDLQNVHNIGTSIWREEDLVLLSELCDTTKEFQFGVLKSPNPIKGEKAALQYCTANKITPMMISSANYEDFLGQMAKCETIIFFPQVLETFSRFCAEAKMLNCRLITTPSLIGLASEECSKLTGIELIEDIRFRTHSALEHFYNLVRS